MGGQTSKRSSKHYNPKQAKYHKAYLQRNPERQMLVNAKQRSKRMGWDFDLTVEDFEVPTHCPVLNIPLVFTHSTQQPDSPSIHRSDSTKGYVKGNVMVVSWRANNLWKDATLDELVAIAVWTAAMV